MIRLHYLLGAKCDTEAVIAKTHQSLKFLDAALSGKQWLVAERFTLADLAVFPYVQLVTDGKIDLGAYPNIVAWCNRIRSQSWYIGMPSAEKL
jgi:glutathione S-transferase